MSGIPIGLELDGEGAHPAAWRAADHAPPELFTPRLIAARIAAIDGSGIGFVTFPERGHGDAHPNVEARLDTVETAVFAAASSAVIGLVPAVNAVHAEPYHLANQLSTLDWAAQGRGGWLVDAVDSPRVAGAYGRHPHPDAGSAAREARDVIAAVRMLWDTWEDDVLIADEPSHRFLDLDRWHYADFVGEQFRIKGPGLLPRPPQGQLPVWTEHIDEHLAALVDVAVLSAASPELVAQRADEAAELGIPRRVAAVEVALDARGALAAERLAALNGSTPWPTRDRLRLAGSAAEVAERLAELSSGVDGIRLHPTVLDVDLPVVVDELLPRLDAAGVLRAPEPGGTLRELFGLARPVNVFELARETR